MAQYAPLPIYSLDMRSDEACLKFKIRGAHIVLDWLVPLFQYFKNSLATRLSIVYVETWEVEDQAPGISKQNSINKEIAFTVVHVYKKQTFIWLREAEKKVLFLVVWPIRGGRGVMAEKNVTTKLKEGGVRALVVAPLKKIFFYFAGSTSH